MESKILGNMISSKILKAILIIVTLLLVTVVVYSKFPANHNHSNKKNWPDNIAMVVSVSSDGGYAVSSNLNQQLVLWDIKNKTHKVIATNANIYSAYFIKNTHYFMWQNDDTNEVNIANINGQIIKSFNPKFPTYGQVITSNLQYYITSDVDWNMFTYDNGKIKQIKKDEGGFQGVGKLLNLTLSYDDRTLLTSGQGESCDHGTICPSSIPDPTLAMRRNNLDGVVTWDVATGKPLRKFPGNASKTFATFSPDSQYVVSGDENTLAYVWYTKTGELKFKLDSIIFGHPVDPKKPMGEWDKTGLIPVPKDFHDQMNDPNYDVLALKFIDNTHYFRFSTGVPYIIVYSINNPQPLKYIKIAGPIKTFDFSKGRYPAVAEYVRDQAIDTAPKAHILVMGQQKGNGIIVFKYDPKTMTLKKIWVGNFCGPRSGHSTRLMTGNPKCW